MAGNKRRGQLINLAQRRRRRMQDALIEAKGQMIEAEHALFVALRLAGLQNNASRDASSWEPEPPGPPRGEGDLASVLPIFPGGKRAA
jgi:hypothetical protein